MTVQQDVCELTIVPPLTVRDEIVRAASRLEDYLVERFPRFRFTIAQLSPVSEREGFHVIPHMIFRMPDGEAYECKPMEGWIREDVRRACIDFADLHTSFRRPLAVRRSRSAARAR